MTRSEIKCLWCNAQHPHHGNGCPMAPTPTGMTCENCKAAPATLWWIGERGALEAARNPQNKDAWCEPCVLRAQIEHFEKLAAQLPRLKTRLAELLDEKQA